MKALVLCGGMPQLCLVENLKRRGIYVVLVDKNPFAPAVKYADVFFPISTLDVEGIRKLAIEENIDYIFSVCADQMLLVAAQISKELGLPCYIDYDTAVNVSNKEHMKKIFVENEIPTSKYVVRKNLDFSDIERMEWPLIVKPVDCYSSRGVKKVNNNTELIVAFNNAIKLSRSHMAIIEEYVNGDELSVDLYIEDGKAKILCIRALDKIPDSNGFIICRGRYPVFLSQKLRQEVQIIGQKIADAFGLKNTPMLIQMKVDDGKFSVIEFCARTGGGIKYRLIPHVAHFDVVDAVVELTLGRKPHYDDWKLNKYIIDEFIYCSPGEFDHLEGFEELQAEGIIEHWNQLKSKGYVFSDISSSGDRVAYFSIEGKTSDEIERKYKTASQRVRALSSTGKDLIRHDIMQYKKDWYM